MSVAEIRFSNVATTSDGSTDLVVTNRTEYDAFIPSMNRAANYFDFINVAAPPDVKLPLRFVKSGQANALHL